MKILISLCIFIQTDFTFFLQYTDINSTTHTHTALNKNMYTSISTAMYVDITRGKNLRFFLKDKKF